MPFKNDFVCVHDTNIYAVDLMNSVIHFKDGYFQYSLLAISTDMNSDFLCISKILQRTLYFLLHLQF